MHISFTPLAIVLGVFSLAVSAADTTTYPTFSLRAWRHYRNTVWPLSLYVEVDLSSGNAIINKTANYPGFQSYIKPTSHPPSGRPEGGLYSKNLNGAKTYRGYLFPLGALTAPTTSAMHYQLRFSKTIPKKHGVLTTNFTHVGRDCGGHCGGLTLDYDFDDVETTYGNWYVIRQKTKPKKGKKAKESPVWNVRWVAPVDPWTSGDVYPKDSLPVFMWI